MAVVPLFAPEIGRPPFRVARKMATLPVGCLRRQVFDLIAADEALQQSCKLLVSATDIAAASAIQLLGERLVLPDDMRAKQWSAMAGLDPRQHPSGSSVSKKPPAQGREPLLADRSLYARSQRRSL